LKKTFLEKFGALFLLFDEVLSNFRALRDSLAI